MMLAGGRSVEGNRSRSGKDKRRQRQAEAATASKSQGKSKSASKSKSESQVEIQVFSKAEVSRGKDHRRYRLVARSRHRRGARQQQDRGALLEAGVLGLREIQGMDGEDQARRRHRGLQRPRLGVLGGDDPDLRARLRGGISARRRGLGPAPGAGGQGPSRARRPHRAIRHPRRVRPHHRQQDGGRSRPDRADEPAVRARRRTHGRAR